MNMWDAIIEKIALQTTALHLATDDPKKSGKCPIVHKLISQVINEKKYIPQTVYRVAICPRGNLPSFRLYPFDKT